eukprot:SAG31_NODE_3512_length_4172_cov_30.849251_5_plen_112_part_00
MRAFYGAVLGNVPGVAAAVGRGSGGPAPPLQVGQTLLSLRERTRPNDGVGGVNPKPGVQLAFLVSADAVARCHAELVELGAKITEPPADQPRGHRTVCESGLVLHASLATH